jgi:hypothetical protein
MATAFFLLAASATGVCVLFAAALLAFAALIVYGIIVAPFAILFGRAQRAGEPVALLSPPVAREPDHVVEGLKAELKAQLAAENY